jgi:hypothetical protein
MSCFGQFDVQDAIFQGRARLRAVNLGRQVNDSQDLLRAPLRVYRLGLFPVFLGFVFAGDRQPVWFYIDLKFLSVETWHLCPNS